jgi:ribonuclease HII
MSDWVCATIIDDDEEILENDTNNNKNNDNSIDINNETIEIEVVKKKRKYTRKTTKTEPNNTNNNIISINEMKINEMKEQVVIECLLKKFYNTDINIVEVGCDEAGRGPMFGRVYSGAVVLPKDDSFDHFKMKDSKKFTSKNPKKIQEVAEYIKQHAIAWAVEYEDERVIDDINILQATQSAMHKAIRSVLRQLKGLDTNNLFLLIDGNYFKPLTICNKNSNRIENAKFITVEGGDNKYTAIAAASILAKVERDKYIEELCLENPELIERYGIDSNKGYGSKKHMDGIKQYGITKWHRRSFGICKMFS